MSRYKLKVIADEEKLIVERRCISGTPRDFYASVLFVVIFYTILAIVAYEFGDGIWSTLDWLFLSLTPVPFLILAVSWSYVRRLELDERGYFEQARLGTWVLWSESYSHLELRPFTVEVIHHDTDQEYVVCLHELEGEFRRGISFTKKMDAEELCDRLNALLIHHQQRSRLQFALK